MALSFSSSGRAAIDQTLDASVESLARTSDSEIASKYEIERCVAWIQDHGYKTIALQFPDEMLIDSVRVTLLIQKAVVDARLFILGDTSYGSCCVDEVAAEHIQADSIIHFGHSCLSVPSKLPVLFVFGNSPCDLNELEQGLKNAYFDPETKIVVLFDTQYDHCRDEIFKTVHKSYKNAVPSTLIIPGDPVGESETNPNSVCKCSRRIALPASSKIEDYALFYVGPEGRTLTNLIFTFNECQCHSYDPETQRVRKESVAVNRHLMRRYYLIEKAKDARIVGILVGTLGVRNYLTVLDHLKKLIRSAGKKPYILAVGKLNVAKLANFQEVDVYVLVACPENTLLDSKEFFRPVITPFELEVALNPSREWNRTFSTTFGDILPGGDLYMDLQEQTGLEVYDVSLVTGMIRTMGAREHGVDSAKECALVAKEGTVSIPQLHTGAAGEFLMRRSWQGLDADLGKTPASRVVKGRSGLAAGYEGEGKDGADPVP
ncbi:2-(3-amino-3-carboxypropyl)histidine synthase subunit 2 [Ixodes scapularis]